VRVFRNRTGAYYGCFLRTGKKQFLAMRTIKLRNVRAAGPFAAFSRGTHFDGATEAELPSTIFVYGLCRSDRRRFRWIVNTGNVPRGEDAVTDLELSRHGDVAWIAKTGARFAVYKLDADSGPQRTGNLARAIQLAEGEDIDPRSLELRGSRVTWRQDGAAASATLKPLVSSCRAR
jgi:hypothetical protein